MKKVLILLLSGFVFACSSQKNMYKKSPLAKMLDTSKVFSQSFTGLMLYEPQTAKTLFARNEAKYFVPASNTKLFTMYASLKNLGDSIPTLKYIEKGDSLIFFGTGDPTLLHPDFGNTKAIQFIKKSKKKHLFFASNNFENEFYGEGWSWDDYADYYQAEISPLPLYGNIVRVSVDSNAVVSLNPSIFTTSFYKDKKANEHIKRSVYDNQFFVSDKILQTPHYEQDIPMKTSVELTQQLLIDTTKRVINLIQYPIQDTKTMYGIARDTVVRRMMQISDNMLAEQLLMLCASSKIDTINSAKAIKYITQNYLQDLPDAPKWVDGSGLSRYNMFTPRTLVKLLEKMYQEFPQEKILSMMSIGGKVGTLKNLYQSETPYVFAKTGTLGGVYNQSGFVKTKSGNILIYSFMNNNFATSTSAIRKEVEKTVNWIHENY